MFSMRIASGPFELHTACWTRGAPAKPRHDAVLMIEVLARQSGHTTGARDLLPTYRAGA